MKYPQNFAKTQRIFLMVHFKFILSTWFEVLSSEILCLCHRMKKKETTTTTEHFHTSQQATASIYTMQSHPFTPREVFELKKELVVK